MSRKPDVGDAIVFYSADYASNEFQEEMRRSKGWDKLIPFLFVLGSEGVKAGINNQVSPPFRSFRET